MRRAVATLRALAVAASLAAAGLAIGAGPATAASPPATGRIAFSDFVTGQLYAVNPDGTGLAQLTHEPPGSPRAGPAGRRTGPASCSSGSTYPMAWAASGS